MKEDLQDKLVEILTSIQNATGKAADFAVAELPDVAQQYLAYGRVYETATLVIYTLLLGLLLWALIKLIITEDSENAPAFVAILVAGGFLFVAWCEKIKIVLMVWLAPKVWLITELAKLVK